MKLKSGDFVIRNNKPLEKNDIEAKGYTTDLPKEKLFKVVKNASPVFDKDGWITLEDLNGSKAPGIRHFPKYLHKLEGKQLKTLKILYESSR